MLTEWSPDLALWCLKMTIIYEILTLTSSITTIKRFLNFWSFLSNIVLYRAPFFCLLTQCNSKSKGNCRMLARSLLETHKSFFFSSADDRVTKQKVAIKKLLSPFESNHSAHRVYRELSFMKICRHLNVSTITGGILLKRCT